MRIILAIIAFIVLATPSWGSDHNPKFETLSWQQSEKIIAQGKIILDINKLDGRIPVFQFSKIIGFEGHLYHCFFLIDSVVDENYMYNCIRNIYED